MPTPQMGFSKTESSPKPKTPEPKTVMMEIYIKDPETGTMFSCKAESSQNEQEEGWSVLLPQGNSIFITEQLGEWKVRHDGTVSAQLVNELGRAIAIHLSTKELSWENRDDPEKLQDNREAERLSGL